MEELIITKIGPLLLSLTPVSLILINQFSKLFSKYNPKLGNTTTICTNLTKTLTKDKLIVRTIFFDNHKAKIDEDEDMIKVEDTEEKDKEILIEKTQIQKDNVLRQIAVTTILCRYEKMKIIEKVIKDFFTTCGFNKQKIRKDYETIASVPTTPEKKLSTVIVIKNDTKEIFALTKGNPLHVLKKCTKTIINGKKVELNPRSTRKIRKRIKRLNKNGEKAIGFALKPLPKKRLDSYSEQFAENEMTFLGIIGITNPINKNLKESIELTKQAGIKTYILTRAKERKAAAIGKILNIINPQYFESLTGAYLRKLSDQKIAKMLANKEKDYVFAELNEEDKLRLIEIMQDQGETIAVVSKNQKSNFKNVVEGIKKGRIINRNHQKFYQHAISCKIAEFLLIAVALILRAPTPLSITLILALDIFINLTLELALRADRIEENVMTTKYLPENTKLLNKKSLPRLLTNSLSMGIILSTIYIWSLIRNGWFIGEKISLNEGVFLQSAAITFVLLAIIQVVNAFTFKEPKKSILKIKFTKNLYLILTAVISILIIYIVANFPFAIKLLNLHKISGMDLKIILFSVLIVILIEEFRKYLLRKNENTNSK